MVAITALIGGMLLGQGVNLLTSQPPIRRHFEYASNDAWPNARPGPEDAIVYKRRGLIDDDEYHRLMKGYGYVEDRADELYVASRRVVDAGELITLFRRGEIEEETLNSLMAEVGFEERETAILLRATLFYPSPQDLIVWQAREVFEPKMVEKYGLDDEYELIEKAAFYKAGMDDEQILNYWRAHWQHPGWTVIREMLHRTDLTEEDVYDWFRLVEIPPFWRKKYTEIMYTPYTRVDVRRMYAAGILDYEAVITAYRELGYPEEKAKNLADFAVATTLPAERDLTRAQIEKGYEEGVLTRDIAIALLVDMGYDELEADYIVTLKEIKMDDEVDKDKIDMLMDIFKVGGYNQEALIAELDLLNLQASYRDKLVAKAMRMKAAAIKMPSKEDLKRWRKQRLIKVDEYKVRMVDLGYREADVEVFAREK